MSNSASSIRIRSFLQVAPYLATRGVSSIEFFKRLGISPDVFQNPEGWLPRTLCFRVANEMVAVTQDEFGGAHVGFLTELRSLGKWGREILGGRDVAQACALAAANVTMLHRGSDIRFEVEGSTARIRFRFVDTYELNPQQFTLGSLAVLRKVPLLAGEPSAIRVHLSAAKVRNADALEQCLGPNIEMGGEHDMIEFDRALLDMPLQVRPNEASKATEALRLTTAAAGLLIERLSDHRALELGVVARSLGLSERTLQRRLKDCGVDFEDLLDETRRSEAFRLIAENRHTMTEIAYRVGYSDPAHFTRAFRRWTGQPPSRFQAQRHRA